MSATTLNGRPQRRQLSDQLDRLDSILDGLSEALNESVADASREGVRLAVKEAVIELLTSPDLRETLHRATAPAAEAGPTFWQRLKARAQKAAGTARDLAAAALGAAAGKAAAVKSAAAGTASRAGILWQLRKVLMVGIGVGLSVAFVSYVTTHGVAAVLSGAGAAATAVAVHTGLWVRRAVRRLVMT